MRYGHKIGLILVSAGVFAALAGGVRVTRIRTWHKTEYRKQAVINQIVQHVGDENPQIDEGELRSLAGAVYEDSRQYEVDYRLILAIMKVESNFNNDAVSEKGARGLLQVKPSLAKYIAPDIGVEWRGAKTLDEPDSNIRIGIHVFSGLVEDFESIPMALHAYHVGPTKLKKLLTKRTTLDRSFSNHVMAEYGKNISILPDP